MPSVPSPGPRYAALGLCLAIIGSPACALLVPPAWRSQFDIGLFGPIDGRKRGPDASETTEAASLDPDERQRRVRQLTQEVELARRDLLDLIADPNSAERSPADDPELRRIVERLPALQEELQSLEQSPPTRPEGPSVPAPSRGTP